VLSRDRRLRTAAAVALLVAGGGIAALAGGAWGGVDHIKAMAKELRELTPWKRRMERLSWPFDPMRASQLGRTLTFRPRRPGERLHYYADGWRATTRTPPKPRRSLSYFERVFAKPEPSLPGKSRRDAGAPSKDPAAAKGRAGVPVPSPVAGEG